MANLNKCILAGNLTRDPETRYTPKGTAICKFSIAINRKWRSESGEEREEVTFVEIDAFGRTAETIGQYLRKGSPILLEGRLKLDQWDDKQTGQKRSKLSVVCETFQFLNSGNRGDGEDAGGERRAAPRGTRPPGGQHPPAPAAPTGDSDAPPTEGDDVPFRSNNSGKWWAGLLQTAREILLQVRKKKTALSILRAQRDDGWTLGEMQIMHETGRERSGNAIA